MRPSLPLLPLALGAALVGCPTDPPAEIAPGKATILLAVDGIARVLVDGEWLVDAEGFDAVTEGVLTLPHGDHTLTVELTGATTASGPAVAAWIEQPDGRFVVTDAGWSGAEDRGGHGTDPWRWAPREMMGTGARWIGVAGGGEGELTTTLKVAARVADRWEIRSADVVAGEAVPVAFELIVGSDSVETGGTRTLANSLLDASWSREMPFPRWTVWQVTDPDSAGYMTVAAAPDGVEVAISVVEAESELGPEGPYVDGGRMELTVEVVVGTLTPGQSVEIAWGDAGGATAPVHARRYGFAYPDCEAAASADYPGPTVGRCPAIEVGGREASSVLVAPRGAAVAVGVPLLVRLVLLDDVGNRAGGSPTTLALTTTDPDADVPATVDLGGDLTGTGEFQLTFATPGLHRITLSDGEVSGATAVRVTADAPETVLYFGDLHGHSLASDGIWHPEASYRHADEVAALDFAAVTDHGERVTDDEWAEAQDRATTLSRPDFLVVPAYEWTTAAEMHRNVYGEEPGDSLPMVRTGAFSNNDEPVTQVEDLHALVEGQALTVPHHPGSALTIAHGWAGYDAAVEPVVEIYSKHGSSECYTCQPSIAKDWSHPPGNYVRDALAAGHRIGFIASGDGHETPLGSAAPDHELVFGHGAYGPTRRRAGLAAVWSTSLTLDGLMEALRSRRCYATTGARIAVEFAVDGEPMGSEVAGDGPAVLDIAVGGTAEIVDVSVVLYTDAEGWTTPASWSPGEPTFVHTWIDTNTTEDAIYYLHVLQADDHHAWSSPVWVDR